MKKLGKDEKLLIGQVSGGVNKNEEWLRINWLRRNHLREVATDESGWEVLYEDPDDGRYWELTFIKSESHGGGAPQLSNVDITESIKSKFNL